MRFPLGKSETLALNFRHFSRRSIFIQKNHASQLHIHRRASGLEKCEIHVYVFQVGCTRCIPRVNRTDPLSRFRTRRKRARNERGRRSPLSLPAPEIKRDYSVTQRGNISRGTSVDTINLDRVLFFLPYPPFLPHVRHPLSRPAQKLGIICDTRWNIRCPRCNSR